MVGDAELLAHYLERHGPEAQRWNLSPESLLIELEIRRFFRERVVHRPGLRICNIGIGVGEWDDYLGYWLDGRGTLTSVDRDADICALFEYRQRREGHPYPGRVVCADVLSDSLQAGAFDIVTCIGSTLHEMGDQRRGLDCMRRLLAPGGVLLRILHFSGRGALTVGACGRSHAPVT